jgi:hypothetical protein
MVAVGERKCAHPAANGRKAREYEITDRGRVELSGSGGPKPAPSVQGAGPGVQTEGTVASREPATAGVGAEGEGSVPLEGPRGVDSGERGADVVELRPPLPPEPAPPVDSDTSPDLSLFGGTRDPASPRSAFTDPEVA